MSDPDSTQMPQDSKGGMLADLERGSPRRSLVFVLCTLLALALTLLLGHDDALQPAGRRALFILLLSVLLWVTEVIPAYSVGLLIIGLQIFLLGNPSSGIFARSDRDWEQFVAVMGHPLIWLFFAGFVLAAGMQRCELDRRLAMRLLSWFGEKPASVLLGVMLTAFALSMFISNTATTAMMLAMLGPVLASLKPGEKFATGLLIGTAVAANLGGMGSLIGTPPNAIAVGALAELNPSQSINFLQWMVLGLPPAFCALLIAWRVITRLYPCQVPAIHLEKAANSIVDGDADQRWERIVVACVLVITIGMWLTFQWHGVPTAAVSFVPIVVLTTTGILGVAEIRNLSYDVLFLMAGGLALGQMVTQTGLSDWVISYLPFHGLGQSALVLLLAYTTVVLSNFMSNTAAANIIVPLGIALASGFEANIAVAIAFGASAAMALPVATPPNAMVYATQRCHTSDFLKVGILMGVIVPIIGGFWLWIALGKVLQLAN